MGSPALGFLDQCGTPPSLSVRTIEFRATEPEFSLSWSLWDGTRSSWTSGRGFGQIGHEGPSCLGIFGSIWDSSLGCRQDQSSFGSDLASNLMILALDFVILLVGCASWVETLPMSVRMPSLDPVLSVVKSAEVLTLFSETDGSDFRRFVQFSGLSLLPMTAPCVIQDRTRKELYFSEEKEVNSSYNS